VAKALLSYRSTDRDAAIRLKAEMEARGHSIWIDIERIDIGDSIVGRINEGLEGLQCLLFCFSSETSAWVNIEWMSTLARQLSGANVKVLPIRLAGGDLPVILADIRYADLVKDWDQGVLDLDRAISLLA
jgi:hypothetical protein